jgi:hypothetical protein
MTRNCINCKNFVAGSPPDRLHPVSPAGTCGAQNGMVLRLGDLWRPHDCYFFAVKKQDLCRHEEAESRGSVVLILVVTFGIIFWLLCLR